MEPYSGDLEKTKILYELFTVPKDQRDDQWKQKFLDSVGTASFRCSDPQIVQGPDGFPYFVLLLPEPNNEFQCFVLQHMKDDFLLQKGIGVVIELGANSAEWVFSYGDIVNYSLTGEFYSSEKVVPPSQTIQGGEKVLIGQPAETYLPKVAREILRAYLAGFKILDPKILLLVRNSEGQSSQELVFNLRPEMFESPQRFEDVMKRISWFLPRHYLYSTSGPSPAFDNSFMPL